MTLSSSVLATFCEKFTIPRTTSEFHYVKDIGKLPCLSPSLSRLNINIHRVVRKCLFTFKRATVLILAPSCTMQPLSGKLYTFFSLKVSLATPHNVRLIDSLVYIPLFPCNVRIGYINLRSIKRSDMLIAGEVIQVYGRSGILNGALTILAAAAHISKRLSILFVLTYMRVLIGIIISTASIGQVIGPLIGGVLTQHASWRWCTHIPNYYRIKITLTFPGFFLNLPTGFQTALVIFLIHIPSIHNPILTSLSSKEKFLHLDQCGFILSTPTIISFLLVLEWGGSSYPWSSATIIKSLLQFFYSYSLIPILGIQTRRKRNDTT
ncbi:uncharacterized protein EAF01_000384 [Botrytis porri]|uniref:uncharacterized protein n=1 Tax=Botrytis porri TaxID=87229 RepID=UPI0018FF86B8|nr:uncharacterized protein EAF01_000384 [Botrytis porri]KAF7913978.1 hypothetical protein EAF01_000384 [Botrytis porri]